MQDFKPSLPNFVSSVVKNQGSGVTIIIATYGREKALISTLKSVIDNCINEIECIIVVDQNKSHSMEYLSALELLLNCGKLNVIYSNIANLPAARNLGLISAWTDIIIFIDDDVVITKDFVRDYLISFGSNEVIFSYGEVFEHSSYNFDESSFECNIDFSKFNLINRGGDSPLLCVRGCSMALKRNFALKCGGFDSAYVGAANGEETDFIIRLTEMFGTECVTPSRAKLYHFKSRSGGCRISGNSGTKEWEKTASMILFYLRHRKKMGYKFSYIFKILRAGPLRRENVINPFNFMISILAIFYSLIYAIRVGSSESGNLIKINQIKLK